MGKKRPRRQRHLHERFEASPAVGEALVVVLDAPLRDLAFELLASRGYRVDGVADLAAAAQRLAKDSYQVVILERELGGLATPASTIVVEISAQQISGRAEFEQRLNRELPAPE